MLDFNTIRSVYFIGIGGIGMSALARYFMAKGKNVAGYDRTSSELTAHLESEGAIIHYEDNESLIPVFCKDKQYTLVVYTPAVPNDHSELTYFRKEGFEVVKRAQALGTITQSGKALCIAGTHGKTTTSTMLAHILYGSALKCNAFLGGISKNYGTNYLLEENSEYIVIEADEYDRSFHHLLPYYTVITSTDPDHLDIYGTKEAYLESFSHFTSLIKEGGALIIHTGLEMKPATHPSVKVYTYGREDGDFHAENIKISGGEITFDLVSPFGNIKDVSLGVPVSINIDNSIGAMALAQLSGATNDEIRKGMMSFKGIDRRFDFKFKGKRYVLISDYAHHPSEISRCAESIRKLYNNKRLTVMFQPHLYTRTRDFYLDFAESLSLFDEVILTDIYPARELPIPGVTSKLIADNLKKDISYTLCKREELPDIIREREDFEVIVSLGAGDIENYIDTIKNILQEKERC